MYIFIGFIILCYIGIYCLMSTAKSNDEQSDLLLKKLKQEKGIDDEQ